MLRVAGYAQVPSPLNLQPGLAAQRHSDPGAAAPPDMLEPADVTLSGDLERLSQHLQSARAMYDSNPGSLAATARGEAPGAAGQRYGDGSAYRQSYAQQQQQQQQQQQGGSSFPYVVHTGLLSFCRLNALRLTPDTSQMVADSCFVWISTCRAIQQSPHKIVIGGQPQHAAVGDVPQWGQAASCGSCGPAGCRQRVESACGRPLPPSKLRRARSSQWHRPKAKVGPLPTRQHYERSHAELLSSRGKWAQ